MYLYYIMAEAEKGQQPFSNQFQTEDTYFRVQMSNSLIRWSHIQKKKQSNAFIQPYSTLKLQLSFSTIWYHAVNMQGHLQFTALTRLLKMLQEVIIYQEYKSLNIPISAV